MFIDLAGTFFQAVIVNAILGSFILQVNVRELMTDGLSAIFKCSEDARKAYRTFMSGVLMKTAIDFIVYNSFFGINGKGQNEIFNEVSLLALLSSPLNFIWARSCGLVERKFRRDLAIGLASSYVYGYLKKVGPLFRESIQGSQDNMGERFPPVLLILVPRNGIILDKLCDADPRIRFKGNSKSIYIDYSGIYQRPYHFSLYEIVSGETTVSCCLEYASALQVLKEVKDVFGFEDKELNEIVTTFYEAVKESVGFYTTHDQQLQLLLFSGEKEDMVSAIKEEVEKDARLM